MGVPNRLAQEGERLVMHRFPTGSLGLATPNDVCMATRPRSGRKTLWRTFREFFDPPVTAVRAVCIPPGARLRMRDIPVALQRELGVGEEETVKFTQLTAAVNTYRDAVRFANGKEIRLQDLREGQRVRVLDLADAGDFDLDRALEGRGENLLAR
jgi:hypothetical protein